MDGFQMIDSKSLGWVSAPQVQAFIVEGNHFSHKEDVYNWVRRFDRDNDSRLLYSDFCEAVTPKDSYYAHSLPQRKHRYLNNKAIPKKDYFADETKHLYFHLFHAFFFADE